MGKLRNNPKATVFFCFVVYISQAVLINFAPLLFLTFNRQYGISIAKITFLVTINFTVQLITDILSPLIIRKLGKRVGIVSAHFICAGGLWMMAFLPELITPYLGLILSVTFYSVGCGLLEVLASPLVEACPVKNKTGLMSLMHSFYCWGTVLTILLSTLFFIFFSTDNWKILACLWSVVPLVNGIAFTQVKIYDIPGEQPGEKSDYKALFTQGAFILLVIGIMCGGAAEQAIAQWASTFAEAGLHVDKTTGDLIAACGFSVAMGISRLCYSFLSEKIPLKKAIIFGCVLCLAGYGLVCFSTSAVFGMLGCIISGFAVGVFWPGCLSLSAKHVKHGSTLMYSLLAFGGDTGCILGPSLVGLVSGNSEGGFRTGLLFAAVFPLLLLVAIIILSIKAKKDV